MIYNCTIEDSDRGVVVGYLKIGFIPRSGDTIMIDNSTGLSIGYEVDYTMVLIKRVGEITELDAEFGKYLPITTSEETLKDPKLQLEFQNITIFVKDSFC